MTFVVPKGDTDELGFKTRLFEYNWVQNPILLVFIKGSLLLIQDQFGIIQNLQTSSIPQTNFLVGTYFGVSYSKMALVVVTTAIVLSAKYANQFVFILPISIQTPLSFHYWWDQDTIDGRAGKIGAFI